VVICPARVRCPACLNSTSWSGLNHPWSTGGEHSKPSSGSRPAPLSTEPMLLFLPASFPPSLPRRLKLVHICLLFISHPGEEGLNHKDRRRLRPPPPGRDRSMASLYWGSYGGHIWGRGRGPHIETVATVCPLKRNRNGSSAERQMEEHFTNI